MPAVQASARLLFGRPPRQTFTTLLRPPVGSGVTAADIGARRGLAGRAEVAYLTLADLLSS